MKIAVEGCAHGDLDIIYGTIEHIEKQNDIHIDLLLCCGDFQPSRNLGDVKCMAAPEKYQLLCSFYKYYSGEKVAPKLTIFIGGNHEASNFLQELPYGGWVAPNIYYMGYAGVVNIGGIRIAGLSGIFKDTDFARGRYEKPPYNAESMRSCYHVRNLEIFRLKQLSSPLQIMMTHDWPEGIAHYGNLEQLLRYKPFLREDIENNRLGNPAAMDLLKVLKPEYWFAAHLHAKFAAYYKHENEGENKGTKFLALDKCLPRKRFLQILEIPHYPDKNMELSYDLEWLTILTLTNHLISVKKINNYMPGPQSDERWEFTPSKEEMDMVLKKFNNDLIIPKNFAHTAPAHHPNLELEHPLTMKINPQTVDFCNMLGIDDPMVLLQKEEGFSRVSFGCDTSNFENSSFIGWSDSEMDMSATANNSDILTKRRSISRTPLKLPTPKVQILHETTGDFLTSTPVPGIKARQSEENCSALKENSENSLINNCNDEPTRKTLKRRNIAIYSTNDDDDDDEDEKD